MGTSGRPPKTVNALRKALLAWYDAQRRDLPWRRTRDPWAIWVSEIMLQQTTVKTVEPRWRRFLDRWPTVAALAAASEDDVLAEWTGLGYYARARNLHRAARRVAEDFGGRVPDRFELLLALPGMGDYTAAAVASIAFGEVVALVDANVERVVARLDRIDDDIKSSAGRRAATEAARALLDPARPGDWNQAMMELGALVCLPRAPQCSACPVAAFCAARADGDPERLPVRAAREPMARVREVAAALRDARGRVLVLRRPPKGSFASMWELPRGEAADGESAADAVVRVAREVAGLDVRAVRPLLRLRHVVMRRSIELHVWECERLGGRLSAPRHEEHAWLAPADWARLPIATTQKDVALFLADGSAPKKARAAKVEAADVPDLFD